MNTARNAEGNCLSIGLEQTPAALKFAKAGPTFEDVEEEDLLIVGTYQMPEPENAIPEEQRRIGGLCLFDVHNLEARQLETDCSEVGGVFRFEQNEQRKIAVALSSGELGIFQGNGYTIKLEAKIRVAEWMLLDCTSKDGLALCTDVLGKLHLVDIQQQSILHSQLAHRLPSYGGNFGGNDDDALQCPVWSCAWLAPQTCASGSEDCCLKVWDLRSPPSFQAQQQNKKSHSAGVTRIHSSEAMTNQNLLLTGSYDDHLRLFDLRQLQRPISELKMGGGVWDINPIGQEGYFMLACMYGGWSLVHLNANSSLQNVYSRSNNGRLTYGADAKIIRCGTDEQLGDREVGDGRQNLLVASCTFDDGRLQLERCTLP